MKTVFLAAALSIFSLICNAQDTTSVKNHNNELGIDMTSLFRQFFNFQADPTYYINYYPDVYFTYRSHFKNWNLRTSIAGSAKENVINPGYPEDSSKYYYKEYLIDFGIGYERFSNLGKRWQAFYGADLKPYIYYERNDAHYWNAGYANGSETKSQTYSIAPLAGFRFKLNNRLSISTEANLSFNLKYDNVRDYFTPVSSLYPPIPDVGPNKTKLFFTQFNPPLALFFDFDL